MRKEEGGEIEGGMGLESWRDFHEKAIAGIGAGLPDHFWLCRVRTAGLDGLG